MSEPLTHNAASPSDAIEAATRPGPGGERRRAFPQWLRKPIPRRGKRKLVEEYIRQSGLHTVCDEARCPNRAECFGAGTATFLVLGDVCTRNCRFCSVSHGTPLPPDPLEPARILDAATRMKLSYVVITMVTRDDLADGGAGHIAQIISLLRRENSTVTVEVLVSDFGGDMVPVQSVLAAQPAVFGHNIEAVPSVFKKIRPRADYETSLRLLAYAAQNSTGALIKSGFMVGLGETESEVVALLADLRRSQVAAVTIGQYLQPTKNQTPVAGIITPDQFERYASCARKMGFASVFAGPFVRSSYRAAEAYASRRPA